MGLFDERKYVKPYEYPELIKYRDAINDSRWHVTEFTDELKRDVQEYKVELSQKEQDVFRKTILAISQVETKSVKDYWAKIQEIFPKAEVGMVGLTNAENEVVHSESYSKVLELLGLNDEFIKAVEEPVLKDRVNYLTKYLTKRDISDKQYNVLKLILFSLFVENVSLFTQFLIVKSFDEYKNQMKGVSNVVASTMLDETTHAQFGIELINILRREYPEIFDDTMETKVINACKKAMRAEMEIVDWIFEGGELEFIDKEVCRNFLKVRFNESLKQIGYTPFYEIDEDLHKKVNWFTLEIYAYLRNDFFDLSSRNYNVVKADKEKMREVLTIKRINHGL